MRMIPIEELPESLDEIKKILAEYDYILDERGWFIDTKIFLDYLKTNRPVTFRKISSGGVDV